VFSEVGGALSKLSDLAGEKLQIEFTEVKDKAGAADNFLEINEVENILMGQQPAEDTPENFGTERQGESQPSNRGVEKSLRRANEAGGKNRKGHCSQEARRWTYGLRQV
jgi:hypothetical protein